MFHSENDLLANLIVLSPKCARKKFRESIFEAWHYKCAYCEKQLCDRTATIDHVIPKHKGGHNTRNNLVCCCTSCNKSKASELPFNWFTNKHSFYSEERASKIKEWLDQKPQTIPIFNSLDSPLSA